jgi:hypothetical protein
MLAMDAVASEVRLFLKQSVFRSRARAFNRISSDGLTHVIDFQMGRFDPPGTQYVGFRKNWYGKFTVNLGIYVPEVARLINVGGERRFVREYDCCIRTRLGSLGPEASDMWWDLEAGHESVPYLLERFSKDAFPFFARFETRDDFLSQRRETAKYLRDNPSRIDCAIILATRGQRAEARDFLMAEAHESRTHPRLPFVLRIAEKLGIDLDS